MSSAYFAPLPPTLSPILLPAVDAHLKEAVDKNVVINQTESAGEAIRDKPHIPERR